MELRHIILLLWSSALVKEHIEKSLVDPERFHKACAAVMGDLRELGVPITFDPGPGYPYSKLVAESLGELLSNGSTDHDVVEGRVFHVLTLSRARHHLQHVKVGITSKMRYILMRMADSFTREILAAETTNVR